MSDYGYEHHGKVYIPNGTPDINPTESAKRNLEIERAELEQWVGKPQSHLAYYKLVSDDNGGPNLKAPYTTHGIVSTWMGTKQLGTILEARVYRHNFGGRFVSMRVRATNGAIYHGRASYDHGECITLYRSKE